MYFFHCTWTNSINAKKNTRSIYFKSKHESVCEVFEDMKILIVLELYVYELIDLVCKSVNNLSTTASFKNFKNSIPVKTLQEVLDCSLLQFDPSDQRSILFRSSTGAVNFWISGSERFAPKKLGTMKDGEVTDFVHTLLDLYILSNIDLVKFVFER